MQSTPAHRRPSQSYRREGNYRSRGFTLVELMVVVVIIGVLATVVTISVGDYLVTAKQNAAKSEIATIRNAITLYYMESDRYPTNDEGLEVLRKNTPQHPNGILTNDLKDPWGRYYIYVYPGTHGVYDLLSYGADGQEGGTGADTDILGWDVDKER